MTLYGGTKIIIKDADGIDKVVSKLENKEQFMDIFQNMISVELLSFSTAQSIVLKITIPEENTPFRSDVFDESGNLLNANNYMKPNTGKKITHHILKCMVVQKDGPRILYSINSEKKNAVYEKELHNEFDAQAYIYTSTMAYGGNPVCPDVSALITLRVDEFKRIFFDDRDMPDFIIEKLMQINSVNNILIGIILMEEIPNIYDNLGNLYDNMIENPDDIISSELTMKMCIQSLAIVTLIVYRAGIFLLDGHLDNWLYITKNNWSAITIDDQRDLNLFRVKTFDFDSILFRKGDINLDEIKAITQNYFDHIPDYLKKTQKTQFVNLMDVNTPNYFTTAESVAYLMRDKINSLNFLINRHQDGHILFLRTDKDQEIDKDIKLIHKIIVLNALIDAIYNTNYAIMYKESGARYEKAKAFQMKFLYKVPLGNNFSNITTILEKVNINLDIYLNSLLPNDREHTIAVYRDIQSYISEYLNTDHRGIFPNPLKDELMPDIVVKYDPLKFWLSKYPKMAEKPMTNSQ